MQITTVEKQVGDQSTFVTVSTFTNGKDTGFSIEVGSGKFAVVEHTAKDGDDIKTTGCKILANGQSETEYLIQALKEAVLSLEEARYGTYSGSVLKKTKKLTLKE